ncbi:hypothetical protein L596_029172 [Steinernema carpocapsae]|uniref:Secreted protein n=1 Tax=Steinernema carpocapsae TaxID=34508 RepID=A0A4U5LTV5_STECR|nr:hypothetical protein L596_029172 [Steinernema carpocapsae]
MCCRFWMNVAMNVLIVASTIPPTTPTELVSIRARLSIFLQAIFQTGNSQKSRVARDANYPTHLRCRMSVFIALQVASIRCV